MSLRDQIANTGLGGESVSESSDGEIVVDNLNGLRNRVITIRDAEQYVRMAGKNPDDYVITVRSKAYGKDMFSNGYTARPKKTTTTTLETLDLPALYQAVEKHKPRPRPVTTGDKTVVVCFADPQIGKTDHRGGTPELLARLSEKRLALEAYLDESHCTNTVLVDAGDGPESFENVASQMFTNDLSFPQQIDVYATELFKFTALMANYGDVDALIVPSNHGAWRNGKQTLGRPEDDWGIHVHKQLQKMADLKNLPIRHHYPEPFMESMNLKVRNTVLGVTHGHQVASPDRFPKWWAGQTHGGMPLGQADVVVTGHYHHFRMQPTGRSLHTGRSKWWIQLPPLDNGSSWYANRVDGDSEPGLVVFQITDEGLDLQSVKIL